MDCESKMLDYHEVVEKIDLRQIIAPGHPITGTKPILILCPWHEEKKASCAIYPSRIHCFGCNRSLSTLEWVADAEGLDIDNNFGEVVRVANEKYVGIITPSVRQAPRQVARDARHIAPLDPKFAEYAHRNLGNKREWFLSRGISNAVVDEFLLGYSNNAFTIPIFHPDGSLLTVRYRRDDAVSTTGNKYWGVEGRNATYLFNAKALNEVNSYSSGGVIVIAEGELDALRLLSDNILALTFTNGVEAWRHLWKTPEDILPFSLFRVVVIAFDMDEAGQSSAKSLAELFGRLARILKWDSKYGKDVTEVIQRVGMGNFRVLLSDLLYA